MLNPDERRQGVLHSMDVAFKKGGYVEGVYGDTPQNRKLGRVGKRYSGSEFTEKDRVISDKKEEKIGYTESVNKLNSFLKKKFEGMDLHIVDEIAINLARKRNINPTDKNIEEALNESSQAPTYSKATKEKFSEAKEKFFKKESGYSTLSAKQQLEVATNYGKIAFKAGKKRVPAQDSSLMKMLEGRTNFETPKGQASSNEIMQAWTKAWDKENLAKNPTITKLSDLSTGDKFKAPDYYGDSTKFIEGKIIRTRSHADGAYEVWYKMDDGDSGSTSSSFSGWKSWVKL